MNCPAYTINIDTDLSLLRDIVMNIIGRNDFFLKQLPISAFNDQQRSTILSTLKLKDGDIFNGIVMEHATVACLKPQQMSAIHVDQDPEGKRPTKALNIPITTCRNVFMNWFVPKSKNDIKYIKSAQGFVIPGIPRHLADQTFTIQCNEPFIVNPSLFHDIINKGNENEVIISLRSR